MKLRLIDYFIIILLIILILAFTLIENYIIACGGLIILGKHIYTINKRNKSNKDKREDKD